MKASITTLLAVTLSLGASASLATQPEQSARRSAPIRPIGDCLVARDVMEWGVVDDQRMVVKSLGKRYYDIRLNASCRDLKREPYLGFREGLRPSPLGSGRGYNPDTASDPVTADGRICGDLGDAVVPLGGGHTGLELPCTIQRIQRIDEATYRRVFEAGEMTAGQPEPSVPTDLARP
ncbi:DUF6491 family protein [Lysobacter sp. LF1]|uniref:DUF6491 family protein n=1 Tax=Lysobacter stagni TaxID=3045172 RepID=A0ABT6XGK9_9GAMM|nr:DUF6491 family protein [Lysobacter sp. LF1]MDI9239295.1 DUF6491 family protein [Lysobacter sp. LF1]